MLCCENEVTALWASSQMKLILSSSDECVRKALFVIKRRQWWGSVAIKTNFSLVSSGSYQSRQGWMSRCFTCAHFSREKHNFHLRNSRCSLQWVRLTFAQMREKKNCYKEIFTRCGWEHSSCSPPKGWNEEGGSGRRNDRRTRKVINFSFPAVTQAKNAKTLSDCEWGKAREQSNVHVRHFQIKFSLLMDSVRWGGHNDTLEKFPNPRTSLFLLNFSRMLIQTDTKLSRKWKCSSSSFSSFVIVCMCSHLRISLIHAEMSSNLTWRLAYSSECVTWTSKQVETYISWQHRHPFIDRA